MLPKGCFSGVVQLSGAGGSGSQELRENDPAVGLPGFDGVPLFRGNGSPLHGVHRSPLKRLLRVS